ncbi:MAG: c-type cytochrome biogenesis protein CcmI, partial [Ahrensia sp.]|nr:c-type cytochrome biogenesis protein CcmI [Ahrensia sp.]
DQVNDMSSEDRTVMIVSMVERLEKRLADQGGSVEEWQRLIRAHATLNQRQQALDALNRAINAFAGKNEEAMDIRRFAEGLGLALGETAIQ